MGIQESRSVRYHRLGFSAAVRGLTGLVAATLLAACGHRAAVNRPPIVIRSGDTCATCGMYIQGMPGPRGEAYVEGESGVLKFGSTRDFFAYVTRADITPRLEEVYVQDTARIDWAHPSNAPKSFIDARRAYYVAWQPLHGGMGPTFASFAKLPDAEAFVRVHGGAILRFGQVTPALVSNLGYTCPGPGSPLFKLARQIHCVTTPDAQSRIRTDR